MKTIQALRLENLKLAQEMAYYYFVVSAVAAYSYIAEKFERSFAIFKAAYDYQNDLYMRHDRKMLTQKVQEKDAARDKWLRKLRNNVREAVEFGEGDKKAAAGILSTIIDEYGGAKIPDLETESETGVLLNLYEDLQEKYTDELELLGLTSVVASAKQANDEFIEAQNKRTQSDADYGKEAMAKARPETIKKYRYFIDSVNLEAEIDGDAELDPFIDYMNAKIDEMRKLAGQNPAPGGAGSNGEVTVPLKTVKFEFADKRVESIKAEVGTAFVIPDNTDGYVWRPEPTGFIPAKNTTYKEVSIASLTEATATFHFFDHREEELRQLVGSALTAPENTPGYYWDPEVPSVMPAEDTSYYELPEEQGEQFTALFTFHGGRTEEITAAAGATLTAPQNTEGYMWQPTVPAVMPAENTSYTEVEDNRQEYQITYMDTNNEDEFDIQMVKEGDPITPPTPPTGYHWVDVPEVMPARNIYIRCAANA